MKNIKQALSIYINQIVYDQKRLGRDITVLSLGEAFFDIPQMEFDQLDFNKGYHYSDTLGLPGLRKKISNYYKNKFDAKFDYNDEIIISAGSKILLYMAIKAILKKNDEVLLIEPYWLSYTEQIKLCGGKTKSVPYNENLNNLPNYIHKKVKLIILNNPNNPSGKVYSKKELNKILKICIKNDIFLIIDETYNDFLKNEKFYTLIKENSKNVIIINSLSKNLGLSGWRIGYLISNRKFIQNILKLNQHLITCAPTILQMYVEKYFEDIISYTYPQINSLIEKRKKVSDYLNKINLKFLDGNSTFYFMIDVSSFSKTTYFFSLYLLLKYQISVVPGEAYGKTCKDFIRVSIGSESLERIFLALDLIKNLLNQNEFEEEITKKIEKDYNYEREI